MVWRGNRGNNRGGKFNSKRRGGRDHFPNTSSYSSAQEGPGPRLLETCVGITEYVRSDAGFQGLIKSRYSDFQVSEIANDGTVTKLTDLSVPSQPNTDNNDLGDEELNILNKYDLDVLSVDVWDKINTVAVASQKSPEKVEIDVSGMDKELRTKIHECVKKAFGKKIIGSTVTKDDKKYITRNHLRFSLNISSTMFNLCFGKILAKVDVREKWPWVGDFVHFILYKENCDTMEAVSRIAENLNMKHIKPALFGYSGTKDRRGKTSQWVSIKKVTPMKIINSCKMLRYITVGNFTFKNYNLKLGDLKGNRFKIALRNVTASDEVIQKAVESVRDNGFINYYGLQRFGSRAEIPTFIIGKCLLQGNFKEAVHLILKPHGPFYKNLKVYETTGNAQSATQGLKFLRHPSVEMKLLLALRNDEIGGSSSNFINALNMIPRNTRLLYIHSYQSFIWNMCVSERLKRFGYVCHTGDMVLLNSTEVVEEFNETEETHVSDEDFSKTKSPEDETPLEIEEPADLNSMNDVFKTEKLTKILTDEDIESGKYSIFDVVLPLPGFSIDYPPNMKEYFKELLEKDNLSLELKQKNKSYSLSGTYRHIIRKPDNLISKVVRYSDPFADLILSDIDELHNKEPIKYLPDGKFKALILEFDLSSSTYATMVLRELLKSDTSSEIQAQNNDYYLEKSKETQLHVDKRKNEYDENPDQKKLKID